MGKCLDHTGQQADDDQRGEYHTQCGENSAPYTLQLLSDDVCGVKITLRAADGTNTESIENKFPGVDVVCDTEFIFGNLPSVIAYEYTYVYNGTTYRTLQVYGANSFNGYVFTYTAKDECFSDYTSEISAILGKVVF